MIPETANATVLGARSDDVAVARRPPARSWGGAALACHLTLAVCLLHTAGIWIGMGGREGISSPWPLARHDHPEHFHNATITRAIFRASRTTSGYDPSFMAGYPKSILSDSSSTVSDVLVGLLGGSSPVRAYKVYVLVAGSAVPWLLAVAGLVWGARPGAVAIAVLGFVVYLWTAGIVGHLELGLVAYFLSVPLTLLATGLLVAYLERGGAGWWVASAVVLALVFLVHATSPMILAPTAGLVYLASIFNARRSGARLGIGRHVGFWLLPVVVLTVNAFWWLPGFWLAATRGRSDLAFSHSTESVWRRLSEIVRNDPPIESILTGGALIGLAVLARHRRVATVGLATFLAAGCFWGYLAAAFPRLDALQPGRHTYAFFTAAALGSGIGFAEVFARLRSGKRGRLDLWLMLAMILVGIRFISAHLIVSVEDRLKGPEPFLSSRPNARLLWVLDRIRSHVRPGERLLYEEWGMSRPGMADPYQGGRFSGLLPHMTGVEVLGGPFLHVTLTTNFTQFGEGKLFETLDWNRNDFERYARLYRPAAILCWSRWARAFCQSNPDLVEILDDDGKFLIGRIRGYGGATISGTAEVQAEPGRLLVSGLSAGVDGKVVLRYHSAPCLRTDPPVEWEPVFLEGDPVPFIGLRPTPGTVTLSLGFPPGRKTPRAR